MVATSASPPAAFAAPAPTATPPDAAFAAPPVGGAVRGALVQLFRRIVGIYFREVEVTGNLPGAGTGGRIFVSNHTNGLVDPILVLTTAPCPISPVAKSTLWNIPGLRWLLDQAGAVPIVRRRDDPTKQAGSNEEIFDKVASALAGGQNILIFPEGTSHNEPRLIELKSGAARMLARARERGARGLTFQAVALEFDERNVFRSRSLLVYGPVRAVDDLAPDEPGQEGGALVAAITAQIREDLAELLVEGATWPERLLIARIAEMLTNDSGDRSLERWNSIGRQVEAARKALRGVGEATVERVERAVSGYYARLEEEGLADEQLAAGGEPAAVDTLADAALVLALPLAAAGAALYFLPYQLTRLAAQRIADDTDELSTYKIGAGLLIYPVWAAALVGAGALLLPPPLSAGFAFVVIASPFAALAWHDAAPRVRRAVRFARRADRIADLRALRAEAMARVEEARVDLGM
jgi:glycerol-3-phosphate O-acyltransferase / dihydroxyacetone phosphate acyltransferase